jgi:hypothetical protein
VASEWGRRLKAQPAREITLKTGMEEGGRTDHSSRFLYVGLSLP